MSLTVQQINSLISQLQELKQGNARFKGMGAGGASFGDSQSLHIVKIETVNADDPQTYQVRVVAGAGRLETNWLINRVLSSDPAVTFAADDYGILLLQRSGVNYLISSGGGASTNLLTQHSHQGFYDGGYSGFFSGSI